MRIRRVTTPLSLCLILLAGCGRRVEREVPESGLLRALTHPNDLRVLSSPISADPPEHDAVRAVEETLELRPVEQARLAGPLSFPPLEKEGLTLYVGEDRFRGGFDLIRANPDWHVEADPETFRLRNVDYPAWKPTPDGGSGLWWKGGEVIAEARVSQATFYDVVLTVRGSRMYDNVPRLALIVDGETISEFDLQVPRRHAVTVVGAGSYMEKGSHSCAVRLLAKTVDPEQDIHMGVRVMKMELVPKDMVVVPEDSAPVGGKLTARYVTRNHAPERWQLFAKEHDLLRTDHGLFVSRETGLEVQGEYRPAIFAPAGTVFEWTVRLPRQPELALGMATAPTTWFNIPSQVKFTVDIIPHDFWKKRQTLFEETLDSWLDPANGKWRDVTLDLDRWAGREATLRFATTSAGADAADCSYSFWSEPQLRGRTDTKKNDNVLIHLIDTVRTDHLGCYGYDKDTSPTIDALAESGILFENAVSQWPATKGSTASLLTGLYPVAHGVHMGGTVHEQAQMLAQTLAGQGYLTFAISDNQVITCERGFGRGCDRFYWMVNRYGSEMPRQTPARFIMETLTECLEAAAGRPFLLYVHSVYPHDDYWAPREFREMFTGEYQGIVDGKIKTCRRRGKEFTENDFRQLLGLYDAEIRYGDVLTKSMLDALKTADLSENTIFVLTADHGEEFMDHGAWGHCHTLFGELLNVPLIMRGPLLPSHKRIPQTVRLIDVAPTLLDILELPPMNCHGETLLPLIRGEDVRSRTATSEAGTRDAPSISIRHERYKYVRTNELKKARIREGEFLFDLINDPSEQHNLLEKEPELVEQMKAEGDRYYEQYGEWFGERAGQSLSDLSPEELRDLKALGYVR
jgi:arylsulfatase A-like enzyme